MFLTYPMGTINDIAKLCHDACREYCLTIDDDSHLPFEESPELLQASVIDGVKRVLKNPDMTAEESHNNWLTYKIEEGWTVGEKKDVEAKTHPNLVPFAELPETEQYKDELFIRTVLENIAD